ncbi:AraC family transcriptional regulator [Sphingomonas psychrotolerans]|uniref:AraC family transcriptional regulator n=1 Tax=Sphingomonas psychrotolerans TaxID=1327635 RepID=UPI0018F6DFD3|nr:AraC family transcriptional regulator [Sphingomonas psychrotolerans]
MEFGISEDSPFDATFEAASIGSVIYAKMSGTINRVARTTQSIRHDKHDSYSLVINLGPTAIAGTYKTRELELAPGGAFLDAAEPQDFTGGANNTWVNLSLPRTLLQSAFARIDDKQGLVIAPDHETLRLMRSYLQMLDAGILPLGSAALDHISTTIVDLVGLVTGAKGDEAELAGMRGLRVARLQAILNQIRSNYRNPALSAPLVGLQLGLSQRYVQDLLRATGIGFSERILELRLQDAKSMLSDPRFNDRRIGDIAFEVGFGDISYFNRSFKRRFGCSPTAAR